MLIDSNVLLDLMTEDPQWYVWSAAAIEKAANRFRLVINAIVYAELSVHYSQIEELDAALPKSMLLTRDAVRYRTYFPKLQLITPA